MTPFIDPRRGDIEDDASSTKRRSMLSLAGSLLAEISIPKLAAAWLLLIVIPSLMLGVVPILASIWFNKVSDNLAYALAGVWSAILLALLVVLGWFGGRQVFRLAERSFWSSTRSRFSPATRCAAKRSVISWVASFRRKQRPGGDRRCTSRPHCSPAC